MKRLLRVSLESHHRYQHPPSTSSMRPKPLNIRDSGPDIRNMSSIYPSGSGPDPVTNSNSLRSFEKSEIVSPISEHVHQTAARGLPAHHPHLIKHQSRRPQTFSLAKITGSRLIYLSLTYLRRPPQEGWREDGVDGVVPLGNLQIDSTRPCLCCLFPKDDKAINRGVEGESSYTAARSEVCEYRLRETKKASVVGVVLDMSELANRH